MTFEMKPKGSDSSWHLWFDKLSKHFWWDYTPVTGMWSSMLYNTDNIMGFLLWILAMPQKGGNKGEGKHLSLLFSPPSVSSVHLPKRAESLIRSPVRTGGSWAAHAHLRQIEQIAVFLNGFIGIYFSFLSAFSPPPVPICSHWWLLINQKEKLLKRVYPLCQSSVEAAKRCHIGSQVIKFQVTNAKSAPHMLSWKFIVHKKELAEISQPFKKERDSVSWSKRTRRTSCSGFTKAE